MVVMRGLPAGGKKSRKGISQPESAEDVHRSFSAVRVSLGIKQRNARRQSVITPDLHDVGDQFRFLINVLPRGIASIVGIMLERHERKVLKPVVIVKVCKEASKPRRAAMSIGPRLDVFGDALKRRPSQLERRVDTMKSGCEL